MTTGTVLSETPTVWAELLLRRFLFRKNQCYHPPAHAPPTYAIMKWKAIVRACRFLKGDPHVK